MVNGTLRNFFFFLAPNPLLHHPQSRFICDVRKSESFFFWTGMIDDSSFKTFALSPQLCTCLLLESFKIWAQFRPATQTNPEVAGQDKANSESTWGGGGGFASYIRWID